MELTWRQVQAHRLRRQSLRPRRPAGDLLEVVSDLGGLHAQVASCARLTAWARTDGLDAGAVDALLGSGALVKTWTVRGTLHLVTLEQLATICALQGTLTERHRSASWQRAHGVTAAEVDALIEVMPELLAGPPSTRAALAEKAAATTGSKALGQRLTEGWGAILKLAAFKGLLVFGPNEGRNVTFTAPPHPLPAVDPDDAARAVAHLHLRTYGPTTREELGRWFGTHNPAQAGRWIKALGDEAVEILVEGAPAWALAADLEELSAKPPRAGHVALLGGFDQFTVAAPRDQAAVLPPERKSDVYRTAGWLSPVILLDGRIAGVWEHAVDRAGTLTVKATTWEKVPRAKLLAEAKRLAGFLDAGDSRVEVEAG